MERCPAHPRAWPDGYVLQHRLIVERMDNCCLLAWTTVHHLNGIKTDNRRENLQPMMRRRHISMHMIGNRYGATSKGKSHKTIPSDRVCSICNSSETYIDPKGHPGWCKYNDGCICRRCYDKKYNRLRTERRRIKRRGK